jgi:splicing factor, arginine/serine-rich 1
LISRDGYEYDGNRLRVEFSKGGRNDRGGPPFGERREVRGRGGGRRSEWRVLVSHLPRGTSWQDLKDFMRKGGDVIYADVDGRGDGVVEYSNEDDMEHAIRKLDDTEFRNSNDTSYVRVKSANDRGGRGDRHRDRRSSSRDKPQHRHRGGRSRSRDRDRSVSPHDHRKRSRRDSRDERKKSPSPGSPPRRDASPAHETETSTNEKPLRDDSPPRHRSGSSGSDRDRDGDRDSRRKDHGRGHSRSRSGSREHSNGR